MTTYIPDFAYQRVPVGDVTLNVAVGGSGAPIVLLHGFPQTHLAWRHVATKLAVDHQVICPDLRGYGASDKPADDPDHSIYSKKAMATDIVELAARLGHPRFALAGHDRGALVAFRTGLDHPERVSHLAVVDVIPAGDFWRTMKGPIGAFLFHIYLLAHPAPLPERMIGADPDLFFGHFLDAWSTDASTIPAEVRAAYLAAMRTPEAIHAVCADYRSGAFVDGVHDEEDRTNGRQLTMPVTVISQEVGTRARPFDLTAIWTAWAPHLRTVVLDGGHLIPEENPGEVADAVRELIAT
jgi:haloacetate dehalogenase